MAFRGQRRRGASGHVRSGAWGDVYVRQKKLPGDYEVRFLPGARTIKSAPDSTTVRIGTWTRIWASLNTIEYLKRATVIEDIIKGLLGNVRSGAVFGLIAGLGSFAAGKFDVMAPPILTDNLGPLIVGVLVFILFTLGFYSNDAFNRKKYAHKGDKRDGSSTLSLTFGQAQKVTREVQAILRHQLSANAVSRLEGLKSDRETPYRLVRNVLPVDPFFHRRPRQHQWPPLPQSGGAYEKYRKVVDTVDAISAGLLGIVGAEPQLRYAEENNAPLAKDRFWRSDSQEFTDQLTPDIFLRFHQSTVEQDFPPTGKSGDICIYKAYAVMNNFRQTPLYLLRVRDVVDVLRGVHEKIDPDFQHLVYRQLAITPDQAVEHLQNGKFLKFTARADRFNLDQSTTPTPKPILSFVNGDDDPTMSFDSGRVWPSTDASAQTLHALIALRRSISLAGKYACVQVTPMRRDVLLVDNQRMLIARREDAPNGFLSMGAIWADAMGGSFPKLAGRWMRQIYGFHPDAVSRAVAEGLVSEASDTPIAGSLPAPEWRPDRDYDGDDHRP